MRLPYFLTMSLLIISSGGNSAKKGQSANVADEIPLHQLHIDLQEGFTDDTVIVNVDQTEVFNKHNVQTKLLLGYADTFEVQVPAGLVKVEIVVPTQKLSKTIELPISKSTYLALSLQGNQIDYMVSDTPFGYQ